MADVSKEERGTADRGLGGTIRLVPARPKGPQGVVIHGQRAWELQEDIPIVGRARGGPQGRAPKTSRQTRPAPKSPPPPPAASTVARPAKAASTSAPPLVQAPSIPPLPKIFQTQPRLEIPWQGQLRLEIPWQTDDEERGLGPGSRSAERRGTKDYKPSAKEYFKGHEPSVAEQAQIGGLIRALLNLNPVSYASAEMMERTNQVADDLLPFEYPFEAFTEAKRYEEMWTSMFSTWFDGWQFAVPAEEVLPIAERAAASRRPTLEVPTVADIPTGPERMPDIALTLTEARAISKEILDANPILRDLAQARKDGDFEAVEDILVRFSRETGIEIRVIEKQFMKGGNPMSLQPGVLRIQEGLSEDPERFMLEAQHELNAYYSYRHYRNRGLGSSEYLWVPRVDAHGRYGYQNKVLDYITSPEQYGKH